MKTKIEIVFEIWHGRAKKLSEYSKNRDNDMPKRLRAAGLFLRMAERVKIVIRYMNEQKHSVENLKVAGYVGENKPENPI